MIASWINYEEQKQCPFDFRVIEVTEKVKPDDNIKDYLSAVPQEGGDSPEKLTNREREVLQMVTEGKSSKEIAFKLGIEEHTVVKHRQNIMNKLNIRDIPGLTKYAIHEGIISL